ncbi:hypothetical protein AB0K69_47560 [Streptomyces umbrinus]
MITKDLRVSERSVGRWRRAWRDGSPGLHRAAETSQAVGWSVPRAGAGVGARSHRARLGRPVLDALTPPANRVVGAVRM